MKPLLIRQAKDRIADILREQIISGQLSAETELTQEQIAKETGLSRMPVREALQALEQQGFLECMPNRHMRVIHISNKTVQEYFSVLSALETEYLHLLLREAPDKSEELIAILSVAQRAQDYQTEFQFHTTLIHLMDNAYLANIAFKLLDGFFSYSIRKFWKKEKAQPVFTALIDMLQKQELDHIRQPLNQYFSLYRDYLLTGENIQ